MEKNHKNTDCYFFYYSTCTKGDGCAYRHEPSALGCETVCSYWQQGSCLNQHCNFRHMEIKKNRSVIPCYWEKFPAGCKKPHCPFLHRLSRTGMPNPVEPVKAATTPVKPVNQEWTNRPDGKFDGNSTESDPGRGSSEAGSFIGSPVVDPLIVNFEEESDSESAPSPTKNARSRIPSCKTYEEIRLEEIQAESAAFYSYEEHESPSSSSQAPQRGSSDLDFHVLSLEEIRRRKQSSKPAEASEPSSARKLVVASSGEEIKEEEEVFLKDAIKTLDQLRSGVACERRKKRSFVEPEETAVSEEAAKKLRIEPVKVPPVRLKRSRGSSSTFPGQRSADDKKQEEQRRARGRLRAVDDTDASTSSKRQSVEVRLCDSSTDGSMLSESLVAESESVPENVDDVVRSSTVCRAGVHVEKGHFMSIDYNDDILKDIDALLTDDPAS